MGDDSASTPRGGAHPNPFESHAERSSTPPPTSPSPTSPFTPQQEPKAYAYPSLGHQQQQPPLDDHNSFAPSMHRGAEGLDDPNSFSPARQTAQRSDTGFFTAESHER